MRYSDIRQYFVFYHDKVAKNDFISSIEKYAPIKGTWYAVLNGQ